VKFLLAARFPKPPAKFTPDFVQLASGDMSNTQLGISRVLVFLETTTNIDYCYGCSEATADLARSLGTGLLAIDLVQGGTSDIPAQMRRQFFHTLWLLF